MFEFFLHSLYLLVFVYKQFKMKILNGVGANIIATAIVVPEQLS
jgi:hypothetical protein